MKGIKPFGKKDNNRKEKKARAKDGTKAPLKARLGAAFRRKKKNEAPEDAGNGAFGATIRSSEPIMKLGGEEANGAWKRDLMLNIPCCVLVTSAVCMFCLAAELPELVPFALPGALVFLGLTTAESLKPGKLKWIMAAVIFVLLAATAAIWHEHVLGGIAMVINFFYDIAEEAQAYLYTRIPMGESASDTDGYIGIAWLSCAVNFLAALPPAKARPAVAITLFSAVMLAFAYYGLLPSWICLAVMLVSLILTVSRGNILSTLAVVLAVMLLFGAVALIDPGENYSISRMDENFRDRFAFNSALIESQYQDYDDMNSYDDSYDSQDNSEDYDDESLLDGEYGSYIIYAVIGLIALAVAAAIFLLVRRFLKKRAKNREGIASENRKEAVTAIFPYTVKWLRCGGADVDAVPFTSLVPALRSRFSDDYSKRFFRMYKIWSEAAYSDHSVSEETFREMDAFMHDSIDMVNRKCSFGERLRIKFRHAL